MHRISEIVNRVRKIAILTLLVLLAVPAAADAGAKLWLKDARRVAIRVAGQDLRTQSGYPTYVSATQPVCTRLSRRHATCDYTIQQLDRRNPERVQSICKRRVDVRLALGASRASGRRLPLNCYLNNDPDYEA